MWMNDVVGKGFLTDNCPYQVERMCASDPAPILLGRMLSEGGILKVKILYKKYSKKNSP